MKKVNKEDQPLIIFYPFNELKRDLLTSPFSIFLISIPLAVIPGMLAPVIIIELKLFGYHNFNDHDATNQLFGEVFLYFVIPMYFLMLFVYIYIRIRRYYRNIPIIFFKEKITLAPYKYFSNRSLTLEYREIHRAYEDFEGTIHNLHVLFFVGKRKKRWDIDYNSFPPILGTELIRIMKKRERTYSEEEASIFKEKLKVEYPDNI